MPLNFELPQAQCTRECCGTFRPHMDIDEDSQTVIAVPPELVLPLPDRDEFVRTAALAVIQRLGPDVTLLLSLIYDLPHAVIKVGSQPTKAMLVRALADMCLVGVQGYMALYQNLALRLEKLEVVVVKAGLTIVHAHNRPKGSTVLSCEWRIEIVRDNLEHPLSRQRQSVGKLWRSSRRGWSVTHSR